ncbi:MAG TPA: DsbA family oxidoreductase [bacterium]|nr:DsbA family oxidoreductase [bacterium]
MRIEIVSDVVCPWCFVGKRRLEQALALVGRDPEAGRAPSPRVVWKPFELNPGLPREGIDRAAYRRAKFGSLEYSRMLDARLLAVGESVGIAFAFDKIQRTPNTFDAHRLLWLAGGVAHPARPSSPADSLGRQDALAEALFRAYFLEGRNIGDHAVLADLADAAGIPRERAASLLAGRDGEREVRLEEDWAWRSGVQGVPHFVIEDAAPISGAQSPEVLAAAIREGLRRSASRDAAAGESGRPTGESAGAAPAATEG